MKNSNNVNKQTAETPSSSGASPAFTSTFLNVEPKKFVLKKNPLSKYLPDSIGLLNCPHSPPHLVIYDTVNKYGFNVQCNSYKCEYCGPRKALKLRTALEKYLSGWEWIRLFTFTLTSRYTTDTKLHYNILCEAFRRFTTELRRKNMFSTKQKKFSYIRVMEAHKSGYFHFHCFFSEYFEVKAIYPLWNKICKDVLDFYSQTNNDYTVFKKNQLYENEKKGKPYGWVDAKGTKDKEFGAFYVTKYVMKSAKVLTGHSKKYTKSRDICLFPKSYGPSQFALVNLRRGNCENHLECTVESYLSRNAFCVTSQSEESIQEYNILQQILSHERYDNNISGFENESDLCNELSFNDSYTAFNEIIQYFDRSAMLDLQLTNSSTNNLLNIYDENSDVDPF